jgi:hypothetical protein
MIQQIWIPSASTVTNTICAFRVIAFFEFMNWAGSALGRILTKTQIGDINICGRILSVGTKPYEATTKKARQPACSWATGSRSSSSKKTKAAA